MKIFRLIIILLVTNTYCQQNSKVVKSREIKTDSSLIKKSKSQKKIDTTELITDKTSNKLDVTINIIKPTDTTVISLDKTVNKTSVSKG